MHIVRLILCIFFVGLPVTAVAELSGGDLPLARWYAHIDLVEMRSSDAGKRLYAWLEDEVFDELREEIGFDADKEADVITALASPDSGMLVVIDGEFSQKRWIGLWQSALQPVNSIRSSMMAMSITKLKMMTIPMLMTEIHSTTAPF